MLSIQVSRCDAALFRNLTDSFPDDIAVLETRSFINGGDTTTIIVTISLPVIAGITKILLELIKNSRYTKIQYKDFVVEGISEKNLMKLLKTILSDVKDKSKNSDSK